MGKPEDLCRNYSVNYLFTKSSHPLTRVRNTQSSEVRHSLIPLSVFLCYLGCPKNFFGTHQYFIIFYLFFYFFLLRKSYLIVYLNRKLNALSIFFFVCSFFGKPQLLRFVNLPLSMVQLLFKYCSTLNLINVLKP